MRYRLLTSICSTLLALGLSLGALPTQAQKPASAGKKPAQPAAPPTQAQLDAALLTAIQKRDAKRVLNLLKRGADPNAAYNGVPAIVVAVLALPKPSEEGSAGALAPTLAIVTALLDAGAKPDASTPEGGTALRFSASEGSGKICEALLAHQAQVDLADKDGMTPLMQATHDGNGHVMDILLAHKADPNARTPDGFTPLSIAIPGTKEVAPGLPLFIGLILPLKDTPFQKLLAHGADIHTKSKLGNGLLAMAVERSNMDYAQFLLDKGADINARNSQGATPLFYGARTGNAAIVRYLLDHGADPKIAGPEGITPLHEGIDQGSYATVELLIKKGADLSAKMSNGETALSIARKGKLTAIVDLLIAAGAKE